MSLPTLFGVAAVPSDNGTQAGSAITITPPASMQAGDMALVILQTRDTGFQNSYAVTTSGGQVWQRQYLVNEDGATPPVPYHADITLVSYGIYACRFNGTWAADPVFNNGGSGNAMTGVMIAWRPSAGKVIDFDVQPVYSLSAGSTFTHPGTTTSTPDTVAVFVSFSPDDNTWGSLTAGWSQTGLSAQYRNLSGSDQSLAIAYKGITSPGATGSVSITQATLGADAGGSIMLTICEHDPLPPGDITADAWQDFELASVDATELGNHDHIASGTWTVTNGAKLSVSATGERATLGTVNGVADTGTLGLAVDTVGGAAAFINYALSATKDHASLGFWAQGTDMRGTFGEHDWGAINGVGGGGSYIKFQDDRYTSNAGGVTLFDPGTHRYPGTGPPLIAGTKYWITVLIDRNATASYRQRVFDTSGNQYGFDVAVGPIDEPLNTLDFGTFVGGPDAGTFYFDDLLFNFTGVFPLGPGSAPVGAAPLFDRRARRPFPFKPGSPRSPASPFR